jgi:hypothetical protein
VGRLPGLSHGRLLNEGGHRRGRCGQPALGDGADAQRDGIDSERLAIEERSVEPSLDDHRPRERVAGRRCARDPSVRNAVDQHAGLVAGDK